MDPTRSGAVLARHAGIDGETGQLTDGEDGPRRLVISTDFYKVYESAGKKADGLVNLYCWAHLRRHIVQAGDANPVQLGHWTDAWLGRIRDLYAVAELNAAGQTARIPGRRVEGEHRGEERRKAERRQRQESERERRRTASGAASRHQGNGWRDPDPVR